MKHEVITYPSEYTKRSEHWLRETMKLHSTRALRERQRLPIVLNGDGVHLRIEKGTLHIRNGFTHYRQEPETHRFFRGDLNLPSRIVAVDCSGGLSFDVLAWLAEQRVALICVDWKGEGVSVLSCNGYAANREKVRWQNETLADNDRRMAFSIDLIKRKLANSVLTLETCLPETRKRALALNKAREALAELKTSHQKPSPS